MEPQPPPSAAAPATAGLDFTAHMRRLCEDIAARLPEFRHVRVDRVAIRVCQTRSGAMHGVHASLTPLRLAAGERVVTRRGRRWAIEPLCDAAGREMLYLLSFYLPRFCNLPFKEKIATTLHELWHISPDFDGDLRRFPGRCFAHGQSTAAFHAAMGRHVEAWLSAAPPPAIFAFLEDDFSRLSSRYGKIFGTRIRTPRLIPL